eukprot:31288-Pelagococcus_subviridis.AAC.4
MREIRGRRAGGVRGDHARRVRVLERGGHASGRRHVRRRVFHAKAERGEGAHAADGAVESRGALDARQKASARGAHEERAGFAVRERGARESGDTSPHPSRLARDRGFVPRVRVGRDGGRGGQLERPRRRRRRARRVRGDENEEVSVILLYVDVVNVEVEAHDLEDRLGGIDREEEEGRGEIAPHP